MKFDCGKITDKCKAECCGPVPFPKKLYKRLRSKACRKVDMVKELYHRVGPSLGVMVIPLTVDMVCPFLNSHHRCVIYDDRPEICRIFGKDSIDIKLRCPYLTESGEER